MSNNSNLETFQFFKKKSNTTNTDVTNKKLALQSDYCQIDIPYNTIALIYPFYRKSQTSLEDLNKNLANWQDDSLVNINTRFYSYIINKFGINSTNKSKTALCKKSSNIDNNLLADAFTTSKWQITEDKNTFYLENSPRNPLCLKFDCLRLYIFDSSIVFLCIFFTLDTIETNLAFTEFNFKEFITNLKKVINKVTFKKFIDHCINPIKPVNFFEYKTTNIDTSFSDNLTTTTQVPKALKVDNAAPQTLRATFFSNICLRSNSNVQTNIIPAWLIGVEFFNPQKGVELLNKRNRASLAEGNVVDASAEGASSLTIVGKNTKHNPEISKIKALSSNAEMRCQHIFLNYIMVLHQFYFLHLLTMNAANLITHKKKKFCLYDIEEIENQYTHFRNSYMYQRVTAVEKYQETYECMQKNMHIAEFSEEARYTVQPMRELAEKRRARLTNIVMAGFTAATFTNVVCNVANRLNEFASFADAILYLLIAIGTFGAALIIIYLICPGPVGRLLHNTRRKLKQFISLRKNKKP